MTNDSPRWFLPGLDPDWGHKHLSVAWFLFPDTLDQMKEMMKKGDKRTLRVLFPAHQPELGGGAVGTLRAAVKVSVGADSILGREQARRVVGN